PLSSCSVEECSTWYHNSFYRLSQLQTDVISLSGSYVIRSFAFKPELGLKLLVPDFREDFSDLQSIVAVLSFKSSLQSCPHPVNVVLIYHSFYLEVGQHVDLSYAPSGRNVLSYLNIQQSKLAIDRSLNIQIVLT